MQLNTRWYQIKTEIKKYKVNKIKNGIKKTKKKQFVLIADY
jgi:hypothetical protein